MISLLKRIRARKVRRSASAPSRWDRERQEQQFEHDNTEKRQMLLSILPDKIERCAALLAEARDKKLLGDYSQSPWLLAHVAGLGFPHLTEAGVLYTTVAHAIPIDKGPTPLIAMSARGLIGLNKVLDERIKELERSLGVSSLSLS